MSIFFIKQMWLKEFLTECFTIQSTCLWDSFISEAIIPSHSSLAYHKPFSLLSNGHVCSSIISYRKSVK